MNVTADLLRIVERAHSLERKRLEPMRRAMARILALSDAQSAAAALREAMGAAP